MSTLLQPTSTSSPVSDANSMQVLDHARMHRVLAVYDDSPVQTIIVSTAGLVTLAYGLTVTGALSAASLTLGTDLPVTEGGTGASTAATARTNLGLVIGTNVQAYAAELAALAQRHHLAGLGQIL